jgi:hypothetical protein
MPTTSNQPPQADEPSKSGGFARQFMDLFSSLIARKVDDEAPRTTVQPELLLYQQVCVSRIKILRDDEMGTGKLKSAKGRVVEVRAARENEGVAICVEIESMTFERDGLKGRMGFRDETTRAHTGRRWFYLSDYSVTIDNSSSDENRNVS